MHLQKETLHTIILSKKADVTILYINYPSEFAAVQCSRNRVHSFFTLVAPMLQQK
jgi:hypothetical protein